MKKSLIIVSILMLSLSVIGQKLERNEVDEFTGSSVKETSWSTLVMTFENVTYCRVRQIDSLRVLDLKITLNGGIVFAVDDGAKLMLKFTSGEVLEFVNSEFVVTSIGGGAHSFSGSKSSGLMLTFTLDDENILSFLEGTVEKYRLYTTDGYVETDIKSKNYTKLQKSLSLIVGE